MGHVSSTTIKRPSCPLFRKTTNPFHTELNPKQHTQWLLQSHTTTSTTKMSGSFQPNGLSQQPTLEHQKFYTNHFSQKPTYLQKPVFSLSPKPQTSHPCSISAAKQSQSKEIEIQWMLETFLGCLSLSISKHQAGWSTCTWFTVQRQETWSIDCIRAPSHSKPGTSWQIDWQNDVRIGGRYMEGSVPIIVCWRMGNLARWPSRWLEVSQAEGTHCPRSSCAT